MFRCEVVINGKFYKIEILLSLFKNGYGGAVLPKLQKKNWQQDIVKKFL